jgi:hypothetical protein
MKRTNMKIEIETITPTKAKKMLELNTCNRKVRQLKVNEYANEMAQGRWKMTGQGLIFLEDGSLGDGQHRLLAIVQSGATVKMPVARGAAMDAMAGIDTGAKRSIADYMGLHHGIKNATTICSCVNAIFILSTGANNTIQPGLMQIGIDYFGDQITAVYYAAGKFHHSRQAWIMGTLAMAMKHHPEIEEFARSIASGENLKKGDPALTIRNWLINRNSASLIMRRKDEAQQIVLNACLCYIEKKQMPVLRQGLQGLSYFRAKNRQFIDMIADDIRRLKNVK